MMRTRAAVSADSAGAPASGALTVQVSAQTDNFSPRTGRQSAAVATNLIEVGTPDHERVASAHAGTVLRADLAAAQTGQPSTALAGHVNAQYLRGEIDPSAVDDPECDRNSDSGDEAPDLLRRSDSVLWLQCLLNWYNLRTR